MTRQQYGRTPTGPGEYRESTSELARPKEAATLIVVRAGPEPTLLMGKRAASHRFMPNKFVFPGGRLDLIDQRLQVPGELSQPVMERLRKATRKTVNDRKLRGLAQVLERGRLAAAGVVGHRGDYAGDLPVASGERLFQRQEIEVALERVLYLRLQRLRDRQVERLAAERGGRPALRPFRGTRSRRAVRQQRAPPP